MVLRYKWEEISAEYIQGEFFLDPETGNRHHRFPSLKDISRKWGINYDYLRKKASKERWTVQQDAVRNIVKEKIQEDRLHSFISESAYIDAASLDKLQKIHKVLSLYLMDFDDIFEADDLEDIDPDTLLEMKDKIRISDLEAITRLIERCQSTATRIVQNKNAAIGDPGVAVSELMSAVDHAVNNSMGKADGKSEEEKNRRIKALMKRKENRNKMLNDAKAELALLRGEASLNNDDAAADD